MIELLTPNGLKAEVPETKIEDNTPRFDVYQDMENAISYYKSNGYVIFSSLISHKNCDQLRDLWEKSIKLYKGKIYRQTTAKAEKNLFNKKKWIMNPILNLQSLNPNLFANLRNVVENEVFSNPSIVKH